MADASGLRRREGASSAAADAAAEASPAKGDRSGDLQKKGGPLKVVSFFLFIFYTQALFLVAMLAEIFGVSIPHAVFSRHFMKILGVTFAHSPKAEAVMDDSSQPVVFFSNHRGWGDAWADTAILGGTALVSRWLVAAAVPATALFAWLQGWMWFFSRGKKHAEGTVKHMANFYTESRTYFPGKGVVIYPEGTRNHEPQGTPLRPGGMVVVHTLGWPVQIVITTDKESIIWEKKMQLGSGALCTTSVSKPLWPKDFATADDFIAEVNRVWRATWDDAYAHRGKGIPREVALLPGAVAKKGGLPALPGRAALNKVRAMLVLLALLGIYLKRR